MLIRAVRQDRCYMYLTWDLTRVPTTHNYRLGLPNAAAKRVSSYGAILKLYSKPRLLHHWLVLDLQRETTPGSFIYLLAYRAISIVLRIMSDDWDPPPSNQNFSSSLTTVSLFLTLCSNESFSEVVSSHTATPNFAPSSRVNVLK